MDQVNDDSSLLRRYMEVVRRDGMVKATAINVSAGVFDDTFGYLTSFAGDDMKGHRTGVHVKLNRRDATLLRDELTKALVAMQGRDN